MNSFYDLEKAIHSTVFDTRMFVLIPEEVNGKLFTRCQEQEKGSSVVIGNFFVEDLCAFLKKADVGKNPL